MSHKRFHRSDSLLYQYTEIQYPINYKSPIFIRKNVWVHASPDVTWRDIVEEIQNLSRTNAILSNPTLMTVCADYPEFVVGMTLQSALNLIKGMAENSVRHNLVQESLSYLRKLDDFAKEMIMYREQETWKRNNLQLWEDGEIPYKDFWPKD